MTAKKEADRRDEPIDAPFQRAPAEGGRREVDNTLKKEEGRRSEHKADRTGKSGDDGVGNRRP